MKIRILSFALALLLCSFSIKAQPPQGIHWTKDGTGFYEEVNDSIVKFELPDFHKTIIADSIMLQPKGEKRSLAIRNFFFSEDGKKILIYTNTRKVWRYDTRGDYWVLDLSSKKLQKLGVGKPEASLMFAKFSPDGTKVAYVSDYNLYVEDLGNGKITALTRNGNRKRINGTFDWVYEEEFFCRDGFRWSPDGKKIAYWEIDAKRTKDYSMLNTTDSIYPKVIPVEYPVTGEAPSPFKIGVVDIATTVTQWMKIPTDSVLQSYVPRMEWVAGSKELIIQHLNRKQNISDLMLCDIQSGRSTVIYHETDSAWIDIQPLWDEKYAYGGWDWLDKGKAFLWTSEKDGWRHLYKISKDGKNELLVTKGAYDVMSIEAIDEAGNYVYFNASPDNATQKYLYRTKLDGSGIAERLSPLNEQGTHEYAVSPGGKYARHLFSNHYTNYVGEWVSLPDHSSLTGNQVQDALKSTDPSQSSTQFFKVKTAEGIEMDGWMIKPVHFDSSKKYPVVFYVYTEPWGQNVIDSYGIAENGLYNGNMAEDGYIYISIDNRGTPVPKGRSWRKSVYRKIGLINISDQAMAAKEIMKWSFVDTSRIAVWGWSGGGSATLHLLFQYPEIYKTGIAIAGVGNVLTYDNIYEERYMGLPQENLQDYIKGSAITYAKNLKGHLLYVHGTGDDNVHYANAEMLINELVKYNKQFQLMSYPNRTHSISEGEGTTRHLSTLYTQFLKQYCPPGAR